MDSVQVAVRLRPLVPHEVESGCRPCVDVIPEAQQIVTKMRNDKFTFNHVFDCSTPQIDVYETAVQNLVFQLFKGYNVTILAYGQTGSGKTYSMGTCPSSNPADVGIIQRAVWDMFNRIESDEDWVYNVTVSFLELYNEQLIDLLSDSKNSQVDLREGNRGIIIPGLTMKKACSAKDVLHCLKQGSENRTTGATAMNAQSSRSHAIFTIYIDQIRRSDEDDAMSAKFHLVDLAGSERSKKTKAEGKRFQEGVNINKELFVLGNVISSLCDGASFVNYRDSKLTRLLQDSLGGNALTLMLACVSPADSNLDETVNTLRYADRARKIKNKPIVNQDPQKQEINRLKQTIEELRLQIVSSQTGMSCPPEHQDLIEKNKTLIEKNKKLGASLDRTLLQVTSLLERTQIAEAARDRLTAILNNLNMTFNTTVNGLGLNASLNEDQRLNINNLKGLMDELKAENEKSESEKMKFDEQQCAADKSLNESGHAMDESSVEVEDEGREEFILQQAKLHKELQDLDKDLAWKEALALKLAKSNTAEQSVLKFNNEEDILELKAQIDNLTHEKEELEKQLKFQRSASIDHKLAEQRRKRVKELEEKITSLSKKVLDQDRIIKMKEKNEEKIKALNREIMNMKQMKVRLINQMKTEGEKYRQWRSTREQEVCKLRQQNRQKETKFVKMESYYMKQQNVYKRKLEESAAVIRRLKDSLALQQRNAKDKMGSAEKVNQWVNQEFSAMVNALEAERTLENLKGDRALLSKELARIKESLSVPGLEEAEKKKITAEMKTLNEDIELRSTQILDLTHKLQSLNSYQENKSKSRYECVQSMADAKMTIRYMFETAHNYLNELHKNKVTKEAALQELQEAHEALQAQLMEKEELLKCEKENHKKTESDLNEKVIMLLKSLKDMEQDSRAANDSRVPLLDTTNTLDEEASGSGSARDKLLIKQLQDRVKELESQQQQEKKKLSKEKKNKDWNAVITPETRRKFFEEEDDDDVGLDDSTTDPDWRKTPVYHRIKNLRDNLRSTRDVSKEKIAVKRNIDGHPCCSCKRDCTNKLCSCKKTGNYCNGNCSCNDEICRNKEQYPNLSTTISRDDSTSDDSDISFKKPR